MSFARRVEPELLDALSPDDPRAIRSRKDLRRINRFMAAHSLVGTSLDKILRDSTKKVRLLELGAGDGETLLRIARRHAADWPKIHLQLLDLQPVVSRQTLAKFRALGWSVEVVCADVFDWLAQPSEIAPVIVANLFIHHFEGERLQTLIDGIATRACAFVCVEPRRSRLALTFSHLLGVIGCNDVTRHDGVTSVRAGFGAAELTGLWPQSKEWNLHECSAGLFSHRFVAVKKRV